MKPLELTVYQREVHPVYGLRYLTGVGDPADWWEWTELNAATRGVHAHRLSDAELAAEYWRASGDSAEVNYDRDVNAEPISRILHRFGTLPSYDEVPE